MEIHYCVKNLIQSGKILCTLIVSFHFMTPANSPFDRFLPDDSHLAMFISKREMMYPGTGNPAFIVAENVNWTESFKTYDEFSQQFRELDAIYSFDNWYDDFKLYANKHFKTSKGYYLGC